MSVMTLARTPSSLHTKVPCSARCTSQYSPKPSHPADLILLVSPRLRMRISFLCHSTATSSLECRPMFVFTTGSPSHMPLRPSLFSTPSGSGLPRTRLHPLRPWATLSAEPLRFYTGSSYPFIYHPRLRSKRSHMDSQE
jgi:hypothetical protein